MKIFTRASLPMARFPCNTSVDFVFQNLVSRDRVDVISRGLLNVKTAPEGFALLFMMMDLGKGM